MLPHSHHRCRYSRHVTVSRHAAAVARPPPHCTRARSRRPVCRSSSSHQHQHHQPSSFSIRRALAADVPRLAAIEAACGELSAGWSAADITAELDRGMARALVAAEPSSDAPLGYLVAWLVAGELQVLELAVDPVNQRRGVGSALLAHVLATSDHPLGAVLEVKAHNAGAIRLYERHGFAPVGRRRAFYADGADALLMARPAGGAAGGGEAAAGGSG